MKFIILFLFLLSSFSVFSAMDRRGLIMGTNKTDDEESKCANEVIRLMTGIGDEKLRKLWNDAWDISDNFNQKVRGFRLKIKNMCSTEADVYIHLPKLGAESNSDFQKSVFNSGWIKVMGGTSEFIAIPRVIPEEINLLAKGYYGQDYVTGKKEFPIPTQEGYIPMKFKAYKTLDKCVALGIWKTEVAHEFLDSKDADRVKKWVKEEKTDIQKFRELYCEIVIDC